MIIVKRIFIIGIVLSTFLNIYHQSYVVGNEIDNSINLTDDIGTCTHSFLSPNGNTILFSLDCGKFQEYIGVNRSEIWSMNLNGSEKKRIFGENNISFSNPSLNADGNKMIFKIFNSSGYSICIYEYVHSLDKWNNLTIIPGNNYLFNNPRFSPDEHWVSMEAYNQFLCACPSTFISIFEKNNTQYEWRESIGGALFNEGDQVRPSYSPDGKYIVYLDKQYSAESPVNSSIILVNSDNLTQKICIYNYKNEDLDYPVFYPSSNRILFVKNGDLWSIDIDGTNEILILDTFGEIKYPSFSPDGKKVVYLENNDIWIIELEEINQDSGKKDNFYSWVFYIFTSIVVVIVLAIIIKKVVYG